MRVVAAQIAFRDATISLTCGLALIMAAAALWVLGLTLRHVMSGETRPWERLLDLIDGAGSMLLVGSLAVLIVSAYMSTALP